MPKDGMVSFGIEMTDGNTEYNIYTDMVEPVEGKENTYMATYMHPFEEYNGKCEIRAICTEGSVYDCYDGDECMFTFEFAGESCDYFKIKSISYADDFDGVVELTDEDDEK